MNWPLLDTLATLSGTDFLLLYGGVVALTLGICRLLLQGLDPTADLPPPVAPAEPDPYEIAYLRGGVNEVARLAIFTLIERGYLAVMDTKRHIERTAGHPDVAPLSRIDRSLFDWFSEPRQVNEIFRELSSHLEVHCAGYRDRLEAEQFLAPPQVRRMARGVRLGGLAVILGLGGYTLLFVALSTNRANLTVLAAMVTIALMLFEKVCPTPRLSSRGRSYLKRLHTAYEPLRQHMRWWQPNEPEPARLLVVGLFGLSVLEGAHYSVYQELFPKATSSSSLDVSTDGCGSGDGGDGGDGGCGGCGD